MDDVALFDKGWRLWFASTRMLCEVHGRRPDDYVEVEVWREGWSHPELIDARQMPSWMNVADLWWRPAGHLIETRRIGGEP